MSKEALVNVKWLLNKLNEEEHKVLASHLSSFHHRGDSAVTKTTQLYEILKSSNEEDINSSEIAFLVNGGDSVAAFAKLILRLRDKIFETLLFDMNVNRKDVYSARSTAIILIKKDLMVAQILLGRGLTDHARQIYFNVCNKSKNYEIYDELQNALLGLYKIESLISGVKKAQKYLDDYKYYEYCKQAITEAEISYHNIIVAGDFTLKNAIDFQVFEAAINSLSNAHKATNSAIIEYYLYYLKATYAQIKEDYYGCDFAIQKIIEILNNKQSVFSKSRMGLALANFAENKLFLNDFKRAYKIAEAGLSFYITKAHNYQKLKEIIFLALFYNNEYKAANSLIDQLIEDSSQLVGEFRHDKFLFYKACVCFILKDNITTGKILNQINMIEQDTEGWNNGIRLLTIINTLDYLKDDEASNKIISFGKHLNNLSKRGCEYQRMNTVYLMLRELLNTGYDFLKVYANNKETFEALDDFSGTLGWKAQSAELIIFQQWFKAKALKKDFVMSYPEPVPVINEKKTRVRKLKKNQSI